MGGQAHLVMVTLGASIALAGCRTSDEAIADAQSYLNARYRGQPIAEITAGLFRYVMILRD